MRSASFRRGSSCRVRAVALVGTLIGQVSLAACATVDQGLGRPDVLTERAVNEAVQTAASSARQASIEDWDQVVALDAGTRVRITEDGNRRTLGELIGVDRTGLVVSGGSGPRAIDRPSVVMVEKRVPNHRIRTGFLIGAAFGLGLAVVTVRSNGAEWYPFLTFGWGGVGAAIGGIDSLVDHKYETVFRRSG
jgi:hypothetical protein